MHFTFLVYTLITNHVALIYLKPVFVLNDRTRNQVNCNGCKGVRFETKCQKCIFNDLCCYIPLSDSHKLKCLGTIKFFFFRF